MKMKIREKSGGGGSGGCVQRMEVIVKGKKTVGGGSRCDVKVKLL